MKFDRIGFVDVGARGGALPNIVPHLDKLDRVLVEPEHEEFLRLKQQSLDGTQFQVLGAGLAHVDGVIPFYETINPTCSSALKVNDEFLSEYSIRTHFRRKSNTVLKCSRYDTLFQSGKLPFPHIVKIDVQGFEFQVLQGFGVLLNDCMAIELETHFYELYEKQSTIGDIIKFLSVFNFVLRKISNSRSPHLNGDHHFDGDLVEVDAIFTKNRKWVTNSSENVREQFKIVSSIMNVVPYI